MVKLVAFICSLHTACYRNVFSKIGLEAPSCQKKVIVIIIGHTQLQVMLLIP
jgi:hypothetical protein